MTHSSHSVPDKEHSCHSMQARSSVRKGKKRGESDMIHMQKLCNFHEKTCEPLDKRQSLFESFDKSLISEAFFLMFSSFMKSFRQTSTDKDVAVDSNLIPLSSLVPSSHTVTRTPTASLSLWRPEETTGSRYRSHDSASKQLVSLNPSSPVNLFVSRLLQPTHTICEWNRGVLPVREWKTHAPPLWHEELTFLLSTCCCWVSVHRSCD